MRSAAQAALALVLSAPAIQARADATSTTIDDGIQLELRPRICTLSADAKLCRTLVHSSWRSARAESLCLVVLERPEVKRCWENYMQGTYSIELEFAEDLTFQLRDPELRQILSSEILRVIREAIRYRHKRREPWNIFQ